MGAEALVLGSVLCPYPWQPLVKSLLVLSVSLVPHEMVGCRWK